MTSQNDPSELPISLRPAVPLVRSACLESLSPAIRIIADRLGGPSSYHLRDLVTKSGAASRIPYDQDALEYNRTFFLRNAIKCLTASQLLLDHYDSAGTGAVLDVGGGIGTFALSLSERGRWSDRIIVDSSPAQIALGRRLADSVNGARDMRWIVSDDLPSAWSQDPMALFSFSLCESPHLLGSALERGWRTALVVDYPETLERCAAYGSQIGAHFVRMRASVALCPDLADAIGQTNVSVNGAMLVYS